MQSKKFYIPIGALMLVICALGLFSLRSDTLKDPIVIIKTVEPEAKQAEVTTVTETATSETATGRYFHEDGTFQTERHETAESPHTEADQPTAENMAFGGEVETETLQPPSEAYLAEQRYDIAAAEYLTALQEYHRKYQELNTEWELLDAEAAELRSYTNVDPKTLGREKAFEVRDAMLNWIEKMNEHQKRKEDLVAEKPIRPTPPLGYGKE